MGGKSSHFYQSDRPESGGADHNEQREKSGILEREKEEFAAKEAEEKSEGRMIPRERAEELSADQREKRQGDGEGEGR